MLVRRSRLGFRGRRNFTQRQAHWDRVAARHTMAEAPRMVSAAVETSRGDRLVGIASPRPTPWRRRHAWFSWRSRILHAATGSLGSCRRALRYGEGATHGFAGRPGLGVLGVPAENRGKGSVNLVSPSAWGGVWDESLRRKVGSQWIVAARPLCHLQCPVAYLSRLQRIPPVVRTYLLSKEARATSLLRRLYQRHEPMGALGAPTVGRLTNDRR